MARSRLTPDASHKR